jgi:hypothetical protein
MEQHRVKIDDVLQWVSSYVDGNKPAV